MRFNTVLITLLLLINSAVHAGSYEANINNGLAWLISKQNTDGSWGSSSLDNQPVYTSAAVQAFYTASKRQKDYFEGLTWLENHTSNNVDLISRFATVLSNHGDNLYASRVYLKAAQERSGTTYSGWGLAPIYTSSAIDTALTLIAYAGMYQNVQIQPALDFLKNTQRTGVNDQGWAISNAGGSDPAATALVVQALALYTAIDTSLTTTITNALGTLKALNSTSAPPLPQAMAAQAAQDAGNTTLALFFFTNLINSQSVDGSWNWSGDTSGTTTGDAYITALAIRALATAANLPSQAAVVLIPDQALRQAINLALGRNAMDTLNQVELAQLTSLSAVGKGINDLTGLEWAVNLTSADLRNNNITDTTALNKLSKLTTLLLDGNPVTNPLIRLAKQEHPVVVPALPLPAQLLMALGLLVIMRHIRRTSAY